MFLSSSEDLWLKDGGLEACDASFTLTMVSASHEQCCKDTKIIVDDLALAGFILNRTKSKLFPQQTGQWLGVILDVLTGRYRISSKNSAPFTK